MFREKPKNQTKEVASRSCLSRIVNDGCTLEQKGKELVRREIRICISRRLAVRKAKTWRVLSAGKWANTKFKLDALSPLFFVDP
ncbi:hypothetical protein GHT06_017768 [Daphnia sinensis]|uniref:Uncharacterized protein n=1 Tax=Daphnia sinensis TaxID=1820382 RepID=A0AAD5PRT0_9CRUS|nr:hypothetical protein GHT06_017768 [Daphnia sinensis]